MNDSEHKHEEHKPHHEGPRHVFHEPRREPKPHREEHHRKREPKEDPMKKLFFASIIQIIILVVIAFQLSSMGAIGGDAVVGKAVAPSPSAAAPSPAAPSPSLDMEELIDDDDVKGSPNAPVTIVEWSDFECPFCARFYSQTLAQIDEEYIKTGKVKLVYRDFPLSFHQNAQKSAEAAECAGEQGKYWEMHDLLFEQGVTGGVTQYKQFASQIGLNTAEFNTCLDSGAMAGEVQKDFNDGQRAGIQGTPGFVVNGQVVSGAQPFSVFKQIIDAELAG